MNSTPLTAREVAATYADVAVLGDGAHVASGAAVVRLAPTEMQLMLSLVKAQGRTVRRAVLELTAWGIWDKVQPGALDAAIQGMQAKLAALGATVMITGTPGSGYSLSRSNSRP